MDPCLINSPPVSLDDCLARIRDGELAVGEAGLRRLVQANPRDLNAWGNLAYLCFVQKRYQDAAECYRVCHQISPDLIDAVLFEADCLEFLGKKHQAFRLLESIQPIPPSCEIPFRDRLGRVEPWGHYLLSRLKKWIPLFIRRFKEWAFIRALVREIGLLPFSYAALRDSGLRNFLSYLSCGFLDKAVYRYPVQRCDLCGGSSFWGVYFIESRKVIRCRSCHLERVERVPPGGEDIASGFYEREEVIADMVADWQDPIIIRHRMGWLKILLDVAGPGFLPEKWRVFEFGCGGGEFLAHLREQGIEVAGMDGSEKLASRARVVFGLPAKACSLGDLPPTDEKFDLALAFHILEHLDHPSLLFQKAGELLKAGGYLYIEVPVPDLSQLPAKLKSHWSHGYGSSEHVHFLTLSHLEKYFIASGFRVIAKYEYLAGDLPAGGVLGCYQGE